jgi:23S rRNA A2030 N6-methylase RlmJ
MLRAELNVAAPCASEEPTACDLIIVNPLWTLEVQLPALAAILGCDANSGFSIDWLAREK